MTEEQQIEILSRPATFIRAAIVNGEHPAFVLLDSDGHPLTFAPTVDDLRTFAQKNGIAPPETRH